MTGNRVEAHAATIRAAMASGQKVDGSGPVGDLVKLEADLAITPEEAFTFQECQAWAGVTGLLTVEEGMTVYNAVGWDPANPDHWAEEYDPDANGGWAPGTDLALKVTVTNLMGQLLGMKLRSRGVKV